MEAENQRTASEKEHQRSAVVFAAAKEKFQRLEKSLKSVVQKSRPYFEQKEEFQMKLMAQKQKVELLQHNVAQAKLSYAETLRTLEAISEQIHEKRAALRPREPGVGAEKSSSPPSLHFDLDQCDAVSLASTRTGNRSTDDGEEICSTETSPTRTSINPPPVTH